MFFGMKMKYVLQKSVQKIYSAADGQQSCRLKCMQDNGSSSYSFCSLLSQKQTIYSVQQTASIIDIYRLEQALFQI